MDSMRGFRRLAGVLAVVSVFLLCGCAWLQQQQEKARARERLRPAKLDKQGSTSLTRGAVIRAYATPAYVAETVNWEARFEELLRDANAVLNPVLGLHLENGGASLWQANTPEDRLPELLDELTQHDRGADAQWVVAFVKSTPQLVFDHDALGVGRVLSKYLVMRASNDPREIELLSSEYYEMSHDEIGKLHAERRRHRVVAVFLHELGHTLGARHRQAQRTIMNPTYDPEHEAFDDTTLGLLRITLAADRGAISRDTFHAVHRYYEEHGEGWVPTEREAMLKWLAPLAAAEQGTATASSAPPPVAASPLRLSTLSEDERRRYDDALAAQASGRLEDAWKALLPLFDTHARVLEVQELRCRLAEQKHLFPAVLEAHCAPAAQLRAAAAR